MGYSYFALLEHAVLLPGEAVQPVDDEGNIAHGQLRSLPGLVLEQPRKQLPGSMWPLPVHKYVGLCRIMSD